MSQLVAFPTRAQNTLNLLFITHPDSCYPAPGLSDHNAVLATQFHVKESSLNCYLYTNWQTGIIKVKLSNLSHTYFELNRLSSRNLEENWTFFIENFQQIIQDHTSTKTSSTRTHLPWMSNTLKRLIRK